MIKPSAFLYRFLVKTFDDRPCGWNTPLSHAVVEGAGRKHSDRIPFSIRDRVQTLTCNVQDRIGLLWVFLQRLDSFGCRQYGQSDFAAMRFALHLFHDRQVPSARTDHKLPALPGYLLLYRERCMSKFVSEFFGRFFLALADATTVDHDVILISRSVNADRAK